MDETTPEVACSNCFGSCCHDSILELNADEVAYMAKAGTHLETRQSIDESGIGRFAMIGDCANLDRATEFPSCRVHDDETRPRICLSFTAGSPGCISFRARDGLVLRIR